MYPPGILYCVDEETGELPYELTRRQQHITVFFPFASASFSPFAYADPAGPPPMCKNVSGLEPRGQTVSFLDLDGNEYLGTLQQQTASVSLKEDQHRQTGWISEQAWFEGGGESDGYADNTFLSCPPSLEKLGSPTEVEASVVEAQAESQREEVNDFVVVQAPVRPILNTFLNERVGPTNANGGPCSNHRSTLDHQGARADKNTNDIRKEQQRAVPEIAKVKSMVTDFRKKRSKIPRPVQVVPINKARRSRIPRWKWT